MTDDLTGSRIWDLHAHLIPPGLVADMRAGDAIDGVRTQRRDGQEWVVHRQGPTYPLVPGLHDVEARLAAMDERGIDVAVVSLSPTLLLYWLDSAEAVDFARRVNEEIAVTVAQAPQRLVGAAHLPLQDPDAALREATRATRELGLRGCQVAPMVGEQTLDDPDFRAVLGHLATLGVPVTLHPYFVGVGHRAGLDRYYLTNLVGHPYQTCVGATRLIMSGTLDRLPELELVLVHGGGFLPYQVGRLDHGHQVRPESRACAAAPSSYLRRFTFDTLTHSAAALRFLLDLVGVDRVAYGTDFPYDMGGGPLDEQLAGVPLAPASRSLVAGGNAARLYGRRERAPA